MSRITLTGGFSLMPEGDYVFKIVEAEYKEDFGKIKITMENEAGKKHFENFTIVDAKGNVNDAASGAFSALAKTAMDDNTLTDIDPEELVGKYLKGLIAHREYTATDGTVKKSTTKAPGTWWEHPDESEIAQYESVRSAKKTENKAPIDLKSILNR